MTIRKVPDELVRTLGIRAAQHGHSAEVELRRILAEVLRADPAEFWARADALRSRSGKQRSDSTALQREMRDER